VCFIATLNNRSTRKQTSFNTRTASKYKNINIKKRRRRKGACADDKHKNNREHMNFTNGFDTMSASGLNKK
jgi:hypothetical protein